MSAGSKTSGVSRKCLTSKLDCSPIIEKELRLGWSLDALQIDYLDLF
jgi:hypothetical protein